LDTVAICSHPLQHLHTQIQWHEARRISRQFSARFLLLILVFRLPHKGRNMPLSSQPPQVHTPRGLTHSLAVALIALSGLASLPDATFAATTGSTAAAAHPSRAFWRDVSGMPASARGAAPSVQPSRYRATALDRNTLAALAATAPAERSDAARYSPLTISLPDPAGGFQRFAIVDSPVMEAGLAAKHPEIRTYAGKGIDDPTATIRMDISPLGLHASVRSQQGNWYIDPYYHLDDSVYVSYLGRNLSNPRAPLTESLLSEAQMTLERGSYRAADTVNIRAAGFTPGAQVTIVVRNASEAAPRQTVFATATRDGVVQARVTADPYKTQGSYSVTASDGVNTATSNYRVVSDTAPTLASSGTQLRTYRLALLTDPGYATYFGGSANVTAAKVALVNRVTQIYESETSIRLVLIAGNDVLNLDTAAQFSTVNGPCGGTACFPTASVSCSSATLTRNRQVIGLLVGASNFDIGHIGVGAGGGGIASLGVVGGNNKAQGCTGLPTPNGDLFAVDYVAHEMGHQFAGNHTFNGITGSCSGGNRSAAASVEPGSGSSIMAYAGICSTDDLQPHSDAYWSQKSFDEITTYTSAAETSINEVQLGVLSGFVTANAQSFQLQYGSGVSPVITGGSNYTTAGVKAAIEAIPGWPTGGTVTVSTLSDTAFTVTFGGTLAGVNALPLQLVGCTGCTGYVGEIAKGGITTRGGAVTATGNSAPVVAALSNYTIPLRTPFAMTASATDAESDPLTYLWEQTDRGAAAGTGLLSNTKASGPLFRQFGTRAVVSATDTLLFNSPGENVVGASPTRTFPDLPQILANNTNAETGLCPTAASPATAAQIDCFSEFLPTSDYVGFAGVNASPLSLNFKVTARDGKGGVNSATSSLTLAPGTGPFLVTSHNAAASYDSLSSQNVTWSVAGTDAAPIGTANVKITLSTDGGYTYPWVLAASTPNTGSKTVTLPLVATTRGRIKVEAIGNVFFDVSNTDFTVRLVGDLDGDGGIGCSDIAIVKASFGKVPGQPGYDPRADVNGDGAVDIRDLTFITQRVTIGSRCQ
jgi:hypothetical protein